jgi:ABC-type sugar transport system permease subunit
MRRGGQGASRRVIPGRRRTTRGAGASCSCSPSSRPRCCCTQRSPSIRSCARSTTLPRDQAAGRRRVRRAAQLHRAARGRPGVLEGVANTALFTIVATLIDVVGGLLLALCLFARAPLAPLLRVVWFTPVLMSYVVVGIIWVWIFDYDWGLANAVLRWLGLGALEQSWLGSPRRRCGRS